MVPLGKAEDVGDALQEIRSKHPKARHVCYAYRTGAEGQDYRINDDGEPSGSAGRPIFNEILSADISDVVVAVVRYFGGTKLGISGLIKAYKFASRLALDQAGRKELYLTRCIRIYYPWGQSGQLYHILKTMELPVLRSSYDDPPFLETAIRNSELTEKKKKIIARFHGLPWEENSDDLVSDQLIMKEC